MKPKYLIVYTVILIAITAAVTRYYFPDVKEKIVVEEKEVIKNNIRTVIREVKKPDGSVTTETEINDKSEKTKTVEIEKLKLQKKDWLVAAGSSINLGDGRQAFQLQVNRRIVGPVFLGVNANTNKEIGVSVGLEF